jgi:hypothetical protein
MEKMTNPQKMLKFRTMRDFSIFDYALATNSQCLAAGSSKTAGYTGGNLELK